MGSLTSSVQLPSASGFSVSPQMGKKGRTHFVTSSWSELTHGHDLLQGSLGNVARVPRSAFCYLTAVEGGREGYWAPGMSSISSLIREVIVSRVAGRRVTGGCMPSRHRNCPGKSVLGWEDGGRRSAQESPRG